MISSTLWYVILCMLVLKLRRRFGSSEWKMKTKMNKVLVAIRVFFHRRCVQKAGTLGVCSDIDGQIVFRQNEHWYK